MVLRRELNSNSISQDHARRYKFTLVQPISRYMLASSCRISMQRTYPAPFQLLIIFNRMPGAQILPTHNTNTPAHAPARALRVGRGGHAGHAAWALKVPHHNGLFTQHAQTLGAIRHVTEGHTVRNLLSFGAMGRVQPSPWPLLQH
jgi:hypothetical protein